MIAGSPDEGRWVMRLYAIAALAGVEVPTEGLPESSPYTLVARREWRAAADVFGANGWEYDRALMLVRVGSPEALREALEIARRLGAEPLARHATQRLRESNTTCSCARHQRRIAGFPQVCLSGEIDPQRGEFKLFE